MTFYNSTGEVILEVTVDDNSYRYREIMGDHNLTLYYSLAEHVELPVGAYCFFQGEQYTLMQPEAFTMVHGRNFEYTVTLEAYQSKAKIWKFRNTVDGRLKFSYTAKPIEHLQMFVDNMNRRDEGWEVGECIEGVETLINYDHAYCWDALCQMASELETEFEIVGKTVHLHKVEYNKNNPLPLSYGRGNGFKPEVGRANYSDSPPVEILYVQGGEDNIDYSTYGSSELLLPKGQSIKYDGEYFEDEDGFNEENAREYVVDEQGYSIQRADKELSSQAEESLDCSDIYPSRVGTVSAVIVEDADNNFYDIVDDSIPDALDYEECLIDGETMTIIFQSGMLAGREFEVAYYHNSVSGKLARRFEIVPDEIDGQTMPNETFAPAVGDTYAVFGCMLPDAYICDNDTKSGAEWDMFRQAVMYMFDNEDEKFTFTGELDGIWSKKDWVNIGGRVLLGGYIQFTDERFQPDGVLVRIIGIKDYINKPYSPIIELSNATVTGSFSTTLKELESTEVLIEDSYKSAIAFTKRRFRNVQETMTMLEESLLSNFTSSISPIAVQTMQLIAGDESLQFRFVNSMTDPEEVSHNITYDEDAKQLMADAGIIQHMTLGITTLSSAHSADEYMYWELPAYTSAYLDDGTKSYYLYAKVSKEDTTGEFLLSETAIKLEGVTGYYHLLVGILNSEYDGERSFVTLYGYTEILPGRITTDKIVSTDGLSFIDLANNALRLGGSDNYIDWNNEEEGTLIAKNATIKERLNVLEEAFIAGFLFSNTLIKSHMQTGDEPAFYLDGENGLIRLNSSTTGGDYSTDTAIASKIDIDAVSGVIRASRTSGTSSRTAYLSASGVFCNNAATNALTSVSGSEHRAAVVGLGFGDLDQDSILMGNLVAGVYGRASNNGTAPAYGGYFENLKAAGFCLNTTYVSGSGAVTLTEGYSLVIGLENSGVRGTVYLPEEDREGKVIFAKQIGNGSTYFYPSGGQYIYDDASVNEYYEMTAGYALMFTFIRFVSGSASVEAWAVSRFRF